MREALTHAAQQRSNSASFFRYQTVRSCHLIIEKLPLNWPALRAPESKRTLAWPEETFSVPLAENHWPPMLLKALLRR